MCLLIWGFFFFNFSFVDLEVVGLMKSYNNGGGERRWTGGGGSLFRVL